MKREEIVKKFESVYQSGNALIGTGAGMGLSAKVADVAGADFITTDANDYFVVQGRGEGLDILPIVDTNALMQALAPEIVSMSKKTPAFAGVYGNDTFRDMNAYLSWIRDAGFSGVFNSPSMNEVDGYARTVHNSVRINYEKELDMLKTAGEVGLYTIGVAYSAEDAAACAAVGVDMLFAKVPAYTEYTALDTREARLDAVCLTMQKIVDGAHAAGFAMPILADSKLIAEPEDLQYLLQHTHGIVGYHGTVTIEGYHVKRAIEAQIAAFKAASY